MQMEAVPRLFTLCLSCVADGYRLHAHRPDVSYRCLPRHIRSYLLPVLCKRGLIHDDNADQVCPRAHVYVQCGGTFCCHRIERIMPTWCVSAWMGFPLSMVGLGERGSVFVPACVLSTCGVPTAGLQHLGAHSGGLASRPLSTGGQRAPAVGCLTTACVPSLHLNELP